MTPNRLPAIAFRWSISAVFALCLILAGSSACYAQTSPPQNVALKKRACDFITKSDAESILARPVVSRGDGVFDCSFVETGFTSKPPKNHQVSLSVWYSASPDPGEYAVIWKNTADYKDAAAVMKEVTSFADAATWTWTPGWGGSLDAFSRGTIQVRITISGLPEDAALQNAKKLAARALGGAGKTGYAYARPGTAPAPMPAQSPASYGAAWMGQDRVIRGTVSRVSVRSGTRPYWLTIFFKESPAAAFVVCSPYPDMFQETVGDLYRLVGKTLEVTGQVEDSMCAGKAASIRVVDSQHYRVEDLQPLATGRVAVRPVRDSVHPYVGLDICNAGKVDVDALLVKQSGVASTHIAPRDCAHVYEENGATPAFVGFAFADSHGQWGTARRLDLLPDFGIDVLTRADKNVSVRRGSKDVSAQLQLLFRPRNPSCRQINSGSARARLPLNATASQRAQAESEDASRAETVCDTRDYSLNVVAYPDTREVTFEKKCFECPDAHASPEQRAGEQQALTTMSKISPLAGGILAGAAARGEEQALKESLEGPPEFQRMNWNEMNLALANVRSGGGRPPEMPQFLIIRGTVSRVDVSPSGASEHWVDVYFRESSEQASSSHETVYGAFNVCASNAEIFVDMFGPDFRSRMIGQVLEVEGEYQRNYCKGWKGSIRVTLARQLHSAGSKSGKDQSSTDSGISYGDFLKTLAKAEKEEPKKPPVESMQQMAAVYIMSENVANAAIMGHCRGMNDVYGNPYLTADEQRAATAGQNETSAKIAKCIPEYDAQAILSNRKAALEYCLHANNYLGDGRFRPRFDACMNQNDMLTAMCTRAMRFKVQFERRQFPGEDPNPSCYGPKPDRSEIQAILRAPSGSAAPGLPAKFLAPPPLFRILGTHPR
jgi:hypothetical protein